MSLCYGACLLVVVRRRGLSFEGIFTEQGLQERRAGSEERVDSQWCLPGTHPLNTELVPPGKISRQEKPSFSQAKQPHCKMIFLPESQLILEPFPYLCTLVPLKQNHSREVFSLDIARKSSLCS